MFHKENKTTDLPKDLTKDLAKLLKEEGNLVQELTSVATKGAELHARLESIEKAIENNPSVYSSKESDNLVEKAKEKYTSEIEKRLKEEASNQLRHF